MLCSVNMVGRSARGFHLRWALVIGCAAGLVAGCGARGQLKPGDTSTGAGGRAGAGGGVGMAGGTAGSSPGGSGGVAPIRGFVWLDHVMEREGYAWEQLALSAAFYGEAYDPETDRPDFVGTRTTPDGVTCDIYYQSGMIDQDPPPPPPAQLDGGRITAAAGFGADDTLEIAFDDEQYSVDVREGSVHPMPSWLTPEAVAVTFAGQGSTAVGAFEQEAVLAATPAILQPPPGQTDVPLGTGGNFRIAWQSVPADEIVVRLGFNLDWDNSEFLCHPPPGVDELMLPQSWLVEWTWGYGVLAVVARYEARVSAGEAQVTIRTARFPRKSVHFDIGW